MKGLNESVTNLQIETIKIRKKYINIIDRHEERNNKLKLKLLKKVEFTVDDDNKYATDSELSLDENLMSALISVKVIDEIKVIALKQRLRNLDKVTKKISREIQFNKVLM